MRHQIVFDLNRDGTMRARVTNMGMGGRVHIAKTPRGILVELVPDPQPAADGSRGADVIDGEVIA